MPDATSSPVRTWARRIILTLVGIEVFWLVIGNLFLFTPLGPKTINRHPERWSVNWGSAWTPWPGRVITKDFVYKHRIGRNDIRITATSASGTIPILPLFAKRFCVADIEAGGVRARLDRLPPLPPKKPAPPRKPRKPGWIIELRDVDVSSIDEFAFGDISVKGGISRLSGSWQTQLGGNQEVRDVNLSWQNARMQIAGGASSTRSLTLSFRGGMSPFNPRIDRGLKSLTHLSGELELKGHVVSLGLMKAFLSGTTWISAIDGAGMVDARLRLRDGRVLPDSRINVVAEKLLVEFLGFRAEGSGRVALDRTKAGEGDDTHAEVLLDRFVFHRISERLPLAVGKRLRLDIHQSNMRLGNRGDGGRVVIDVPESEVPDISVLDSWLPGSLALRLVKGRATMSARLESPGRGENAHGEFVIRGKGLTGRFRDLGFTVDLSAETRISGRNWNELEVLVDGSELRLTNGVFTGKGVPVEPGWWLTFGVKRGTADLKAPLNVEADVELSMRDLRAVIAIVAEVKAWLSRFDGLLNVRDLKGSVHTRLAGRKLGLDDLNLAGDKLDVKGDVDLTGDVGNGLLWLRFRRRAVAFEWAGAEKEWKFVNDREWFEARHAARHGSTDPPATATK